MSFDKKKKLEEVRELMEQYNAWHPQEEHSEKSVFMKDTHDMLNQVGEKLKELEDLTIRYGGLLEMMMDAKSKAKATVTSLIACGQ